MILTFISEEVRRACCDQSRMVRRWGPEVARRISRRLQQLEAMESLTDLSFAPFNSHDHGNGVIQVVVSDGVSLFIDGTGEGPQEGPAMYTVTVTAVRARLAANRAS